MKSAVCSLICFYGTWSCCRPDAKPGTNETMMEFVKLVLTVVSCYKTLNQLFYKLKTIAYLKGWKQWVTFIIVIQIPESMIWVFLSHHVNLLPRFDLVAILHIFNPGCLKSRHCIQKFVLEALHLYLSKWIVEIMPKRLSCFAKCSGTSDSHLEQSHPGLVLMEFKYYGLHSKGVKLCLRQLLEVIPPHFFGGLHLQFLGLPLTQPRRSKLLQFGHVIIIQSLHELVYCSLRYSNIALLSSCHPR